MIGSGRGRATVAGALALALAACGSGGTGTVVRPSPIPPPTGGTPTPTPTPTTGTQTVDYDTAEYRASSGPYNSGAITAYDKGATGAGVGIGIIDTGINPALSEFAGRISAASGDAAGNRGTSDEDGHGTAVATVAAAARDGRETMGVAFDATVVAVRVDEVGSCTSADGCVFWDNDIAAGIDRAVAGGARVINLSMGGDDGISRSVAQAVGRAANAGVVLVVSAGNEGTIAPSAFAAELVEAGNGNVIIVGALRAGVLASYSNRAGAQANVYLSAVGDHRAPDHTGQYFNWSGTSFSAPVVAGAVALLAQAFPNLTGAQLVQILLESGDDLGAAGTDGIYGRGALNIARAFQPRGATMMAGSDTEIALASNGTLPAAAGDAGGLAGETLVVTDAYERAYELDVGQTLDAAGAAGPMQSAFTALEGGVRTEAVGAGPLSLSLTMAGDRPVAGLDETASRSARLLAARIVTALDARTSVALGIRDSAAAIVARLDAADGGVFMAARDESLGFAARSDGAIAARHQMGPVALTASAESGTVLEARRSPLEEAAGYRSLSLGASGTLGALGDGGLSWTRLEESETLLGGRLSAALGGGTGATTDFLDARWSRDLGSGWSLGLDARAGFTRFGGGDFRTSAYGAEVMAEGLFGPDRIGLRVSQPLRIEQGGLALDAATGWDWKTETATMGTRRFSLSPSGRERVAELAYGRALGLGWVDANLYRRFEPGHVKDAPADTGVRVGYRLGF